MKAALLGGGGGGRRIMILALHLCTLCPWIRKCLNIWSYSYPVKHNSQNSQGWVWSWCLIAFQGTERMRNQSVHSDLMSFPELLAGVLYPALCLLCLAWLAGPQTCCVTASMSIPMPAPLFLIFRQAETCWGGHCPACLAVATALGCLSCAGELSTKTPWYEDHRLYCYLSWSWEVLLLIRCSENGCLINTIDITGHWPRDLKCSVTTGSVWLLVSIIFTCTY